MSVITKIHKSILVIILGSDGLLKTKNSIILISSIILIVFIPFLYIINNHIQKPVINTNHRLEWWLDEIKAEKAWNIAKGKGIKIAVIDTGVDVKHPDLTNSILENIKLEQDSSNDNKFYHGTSITGIISARPTNHDGLIGIAPKSQIISIDISSKKPEKSINYLIQAINYAIGRNVDIINISMGIKKDNADLHSAIKKAFSKNILIVAAAGNQGKDTGILFPAKYKEVISVGSYDKKRKIIKEFNDSKDITIFAPGVNIVTTNTTYQTNLYTSTNGTSASSAIISGIMALVKEANPKIKNEQVLNYLYNYKQDQLDAEKILNGLKLK